MVPYHTEPSEDTLSIPKRSRCYDAVCRRKLATLIGSDAQLNDLVIYASPFTRTVETARYAAESMGIPAERVQEADELRERFFGDYDLKPDTSYPTSVGKGQA